MRATSQDNVVRGPMSEKLGRLPSVGFWIVITLLVAVLVICLLGSIIGLIGAAISAPNHGPYAANHAPYE